MIACPGRESNTPQDGNLKVNLSGSLTTMNQMTSNINHMQTHMASPTHFRIKHLPGKSSISIRLYTAGLMG